MANKYQRNSSNSKLISSNVLVNCWPISHGKSTKPNIKNPYVIDIHKITESILSRNCQQNNEFIDF